MAPRLELVKRFVNPVLFTRYSTVISFDFLPGGARVDQALGAHGMRLHLGAGPDPLVWRDAFPRCYPPSGAHALSNYGFENLSADPQRLRRGPGDPECAWWATFEAPVNRFGFEIRGVDRDAMNVVVRCFDKGVELGSQFFEVSRAYRFVGVQCIAAFDEVLIDVTNPSDALFSVDNVRYELDLRDRDHDAAPDFGDDCPNVFDPEQVDSDGDGIGDLCDPFPMDAENDVDGDGIGKQQDNCPLLYNPDQRDADRDGVGDVCDFVSGSDQDNDGVPDAADNCPTTFNPEQADCDLDGIGDVCDPTLIDPAAVSFTLSPGGCVTLTKHVCLPPAPPVVDVVIAFDTTGSMGGEILALRQNIVTFVNGVRQALPLSDISFGLVTFKDYPGHYASCGYSENYSLLSDTPFSVQAPIGTPDLQLLQTINTLTASGGQDAPEAYSRVLWEITQPDSGIGFRSDSARFVMLVGDAPPHDCNVGLGLSGCLNPNTTGSDPGRDGLILTADDVDFQDDALRRLLATDTRVLMIFSAPFGLCAWERWCGLTGGSVVHASADGQLPPGTDLVNELVTLIRHPFVGQVTYAAESDCDLGITFDPPLIPGPIDVSLGAQVSFTETICVPPIVPSGSSIDCAVKVFADNVLIGTQTIHVDVQCGLHTLDFETDDDFSTALDNGQTIGTPPEFGRLVRISSAGSNLGCTTFDSTPGGPNDPSINSDMLIGHGNLLLLQDNHFSQQSVPGYFDQVTDDPDGGDMIFDFTSPVDPKSLLLADLDPPPNLGASVNLLDGNGKKRVYAIDPGWTGTWGNPGPWRLDLTTLQPQPGNGTPRWARASEDAGFLQSDVLRIVVHMTGHGALDELTFCK